MFAHKTCFDTNPQIIKLASTQKEQTEHSIIAYHTRKNETFYCRNPAMLCPKYIGICSFIKPTIVVDDDKSFCCKVQGIYRRRDWYDGTTSTRKNRGTRWSWNYFSSFWVKKRWRYEEKIYQWSWCCYFMYVTVINIHDAATSSEMTAQIPLLCDG